MIRPSRVFDRGRVGVDCALGFKAESFVSWADDKAKSACLSLVLGFSIARHGPGEASDKVATLLVICVALSPRDVLLCLLAIFGCDIDVWYMHCIIVEEKRIVDRVTIRHVFRGEIQRCGNLRTSFYEAKGRAGFV